VAFGTADASGAPVPVLKGIAGANEAESRQKMHVLEHAELTLRVAITESASDRYSQ
jgi:hypothetical protein